MFWENVEREKSELRKFNTFFQFDADKDTFDAMRRKYMEKKFHERKKKKHKKKKKRKKRKKHHNQAQQYHYYHHGGHHDDKSKIQKYILPLLLAYKLKFFTMIPIFIGKYLEAMKKETVVKNSGPMMTMVNNMKSGANSFVIIVIALLKNLIGGLMAALSALEDYLTEASAPLDLNPLPSYLEPITDILQPTHRDENPIEKIVSQFLPNSGSTSSNSLIEGLISTVLMTPMSLLLPQSLKPKPRPMVDLFKKFFKYKGTLANKLWQ